MRLQKLSSFLFFFFLIILFLLSFIVKEKSNRKETNPSILLIGNSNEPKGIDPHLVSGVLEANLLRSLFEGLCIEHPSLDGVSLPGVAERWESYQNQTVWIFHLRKDARWSDGKELTASDFVFSYHRILSPNLGAVYSEMLYFLKNAKEYNKNEIEWILFGEESPFKLKKTILNKIPWRSSPTSQGLLSLKIQELENLQKNPNLVRWPSKISPNLAKRILSDLIQYRKEGSPDLWEKAKVGVEEIDKYTIKLTLRNPTAYLPELTKHISWFPVPRHIILKYGNIDTPFTTWTNEGNFVSNGPFSLKKWRFNHLIEVERNPYYWDKENVALDGIKFFPISNPYTEARMFDDDLLHITYSIPPSLISWGKENYPQEFREENYLGTRFVRFNIEISPLHLTKVRKALNLALDKNKYTKQILKGGQQPAYSLVPPMSAYQSPKIESFNPIKARRLLKEAGFPNGENFPKLTFLTTDRETAKKEAEAIQEMWKKNLNISVRIEQKEWTSFLEDQYQGRYQISAGGWIGDYIDPTTFLDLWTKTNGNNCTNWANQKYEKLLNESRQFSGKKRAVLLKSAEALLLEEMPIAPLYWYTTNYLVHQNVQNWHPLLLKTQPYKYLSLKKEK